MNNLHLVLGGPGCGKTTRLLELCEQELARGVPPTAIAFVTFTKNAATEARERAAEKFGFSAEDDLPWFRTIHSLAYAKLNMTRDEMMDRRDWTTFGEVVGERLSGMASSEDGAPVGVSGREVGDQLLRISDYASTTCVPLEQAWHDLDEAVDWWRLQRFTQALAAYKADTGKMDFTDLLHTYVAQGTPVDVQVAFIDEAQDLTAAQWRAVRHAFAGAERVYVGGDDDQAIYHWAGADVQQFLNLTATPEVLHLSHRLPRQIHALSQQVARRISARYVKQFTPSDRDGTIEWHQHAHAVDMSDAGFTPKRPGHYEWFLLARNNYMLRPLEAVVREYGFNYSTRLGPAVRPHDVRMMQLWERLRSGKVSDMSAAELRALSKLLGQPKPQTREAARYTLAEFGWDAWARKPWFEALTGLPTDRRDYYLACLRRGEKLTKAPRIHIDTIHGVKGQEADKVMLLTDMSGRTAASYRLNADNEHRVFYVGITRAEQQLHIVMPQSDQAYPLA
jgi:superfamily I DNA/RNA helicase